MNGKTRSRRGRNPSRTTPEYRRKPEVPDFASNRFLSDCARNVLIVELIVQFIPR